MRKLLNTLYITTKDAYLSLENDNVIVHCGEEKTGQFPLTILENIVSFSYRGASPALMGACAERGVGFAFMTPNGRLLASVSGETCGNVLLRKEQYRISDSLERSCILARCAIFGKVYNQRWLIERTLRDHPLRVEAPALENASAILQGRLQTILTTQDLDTLRGLEGEAATAYFGVFDHLILNQKEQFFFDGRSRRPPQDRVNAMLSFLYAILANDCASALQSVGLDPYVGFMHRDRPGRASLALDLMEELRAPFVDRFVLTLINNRQIQQKHFVHQSSGAVLLTDEGRKLLLNAWQTRKREEIRHPYLKEKLSWGLVPFVQALLLARTVRGDLDAYPAFLWK